jgi:hypothetical protein
VAAGDLCLPKITVQAALSLVTIKVLWQPAALDNPSDARLISAEFMEHRRILGLQAVVEHGTATGV